MIVAGSVSDDGSDSGGGCGAIGGGDGSWWRL